MWAVLGGQEDSRRIPGGSFFPPQGAGNVVTFQAGASQPGDRDSPLVVLHQLRVRVRALQFLPSAQDQVQQGQTELWGQRGDQPPLSIPCGRPNTLQPSWERWHGRKKKNRPLPAQEGLRGATFPPQIPGLEHRAQQDRAGSCFQAEAEPGATSHR